MTGAPERIWIHPSGWNWSPSSGGTQDDEYIRADLAPQWQPIETAPKDGRTILVCLPRMMNLIVRASYNTVHAYWKTDFRTDGGITNPTFFHDGDFWMPLPKPPSPAD